MKENGKQKKLNDKGSALLTVIIAIIFLTLLATTLLYITGMNFMIKQADYQNKRNFYSGETALETIKANLMQNIVSEAAQEAYADASTRYVTAGTGDVREAQYNIRFTEIATEKLQTAIGSNNWAGYLGSMYSVPAGYTVKLTMDDPDVHLDGATGELSSSAANFKVDETQGILTIKGIHVLYINAKDNKSYLATKISTDLELHAPPVDWSVSSSQVALTVPDPGEGETEDQVRAATQSDVLKKKMADVSRCVKYTNWVKE